MSKRVTLTEQDLEKIAILYRNNLSVIETAIVMNLGKNRIRNELKKMGILLTLSEYAKLRKGEKNHFYGKKHNSEVRARLSEHAKTRTAKRNPNYKNGNYVRRPRDFKISQFTPIRNKVYNRDNYTCQITGIKGGHLHAHHLIPYWVCKDAFFDIDNLITVSTKAHFEICHNKNWIYFNVDLISDKLLQKYSLNRERLNELAGPRPDAIVRSSAINKTEELSLNTEDNVQY